MPEAPNLIALQALLEGLRKEAGANVLIVSVGVRAPTSRMPEGSAIATVRIGIDQATSEAVGLRTAIDLAKGKCERARAARLRKDAPPAPAEGSADHDHD